jgi:hypothetical protein
MNFLGKLALCYLAYQIFHGVAMIIWIVPASDWAALFHYIRTFLVDGAICIGLITIYYAVVHGAEWVIGKALPDGAMKTALLKRYGGGHRQ